MKFQFGKGEYGSLSVLLLHDFKIRNLITANYVFFNIFVQKYSTVKKLNLDHPST